MAQKSNGIASVSKEKETNNVENEVPEMVQEQIEKEFNDSQFMASGETYKNIIKQMIGSGCKRINSIRIKNVNFTEKDNYTMVSFTLASPIRGYVNNGNGVYEVGMTNTLFTSLYAITGAMKEDENLGWMANSLLENPTALNLILNGATVDIIQQEVITGEEYVNPFSTRNDNEPVIYDHDLIINHIVGFKLSKVGEKMSDRLADKLMGF